MTYGRWREFVIGLAFVGVAYGAFRFLPNEYADLRKAIILLATVVVFVIVVRGHAAFINSLKNTRGK